MRRLTIIALGLMFCASAGCVSETPDRVAVRFFKAMLDGDLESARRLSVTSDPDYLTSAYGEELRNSEFMRLIGAEMQIGELLICDVADVKFKVLCKNGKESPGMLRLWKMDGKWKVALTPDWAPWKCEVAEPLDEKSSSSDATNHKWPLRL